jgi:hypothetical protein
MAFDYEALVGHLYVVNGRAISTTPPGALVEVAPKKAVRGRETDTFFALVLPSGETTAPALFYEQMAQLCAERYFDSTGSVTSGLRAAFAHLNENLFEHNQRESSHYEATLLCAVLRGSDLYVARIGAGATLYWHEGEMRQFPEDFSNDDALFGIPLGVRMSPDVKMTMYQVTNGSRLVISDPAVADFETAAIQTALTRDDIGEALVGLKDLARGNITLMAVEFVPPEVPTALPVRVTDSTRSLPPVPAPASTAEMTAAPTATAPSSASPPRDDGKPRLSDTRGEGVKRAVGGAAIGAANAIDGVNNTMDRVMPPPKAGDRGFMSTPIAAALALLIPIIVVVVVVFFWLSGTGQSEFDRCVSEAYQAANLARSIDSADMRGTLTAWSAAELVIARCEELRPNDPQMAALHQEAQGVTDSLLAIERRDTGVIDSLPSAILTRVVLQGEDLYVLDDGNDIVYRVALTPDGRNALAGTRQPIAAMRRGGIVNQFEVGDIIDIAWADNDAGLQQGSVITALDSSGVLINCPPSFIQQCSAQQLNTSPWVQPVAMEFWQGRLYILDPAANQIWRYDPSAGAYPNAGIEYFVGEGRPDIRNAVDFAIDTPGSIYVLLNDGTMLKYTSGQRVGFAYSNFPDGQPLTSVNSMFLNSNPTDLMLYLVSQAEDTVFQTTLAGTFAASYRAGDDAMFDSLADVAVDSNKDLIYAVSGNSIFVFERQE